MDIEKNNEGKVLFMKEHRSSKEKKEELNEMQDANTNIQVNNTTIDTAIRNDEGAGTSLTIRSYLSFILIS